MGTTTEQGTPQATPDAGSTPEQGKPRVQHVQANRTPQHVAAQAKASGKLPTWATHANPDVATVLAYVAADYAAAKRYKTMPELCNACGVRGVPKQRNVRGLPRAAGMGVGRGSMYQAPATVLRAAAVHLAKQRAAQAKAKRS